MGAVVGVFAVAVLEESYGSSVVLVLLGSIAFLGAAITNLFVPETLGISLDAEDAHLPVSYTRFSYFEDDDIDDKLALDFDDEMQSMFYHSLLTWWTLGSTSVTNTMEDGRNSGHNKT